MGLRCKKALVVFTGRRTYLVTRDIVECLKTKVGYNLDDVTTKRIRVLEEAFISEFWKYIPLGIEKEEVLVDIFKRSLEEKVLASERKVLSLDRIYVSNADFYLDITRETDSRTGEVKLSARNGCKTLEEQIKSFKGYDEIDLVDVGVFDGDTLLEVYNLLEAEGVSVGEVFLAVADKNGYNRVNEVKKVNVDRIFNFYEWIELRDFFGIDGRSVLSKDGIRRFIPYWENLGAWAGIPMNNIEDVRSLCLRTNKELKKILENGGFDLNKIGEAVIFRGEK